MGASTRNEGEIKAGEMPIKSQKRMSDEKEDAEHQQRNSPDRDQEGEEEITKVLK
jgi:hypothetical protein